MEPYRIALLGLGTVGRNVVQLLADTADHCTARAGRAIEVRRIVVGDPSRDRDVPAHLLGPATIGGDTGAALAADDVDCIVELVGGEELPRQWIRTALEAGKDVVTANKAVLAVHGEELFEVATEQGRRLYFEASVAAAVPILQVLQQGIPAGPVDKLTGILNGTCNYILARLEEDFTFEEAVVAAQEAGLAEADPTLDLSGMDSAHKLVLLARILLGNAVSLEKVRVEGITEISSDDIEFGLLHDWRLKLLGTIERNSSGVSLGVMPRFIPGSHPLSGVGEEDNAVLLEAQPFGTLMLQGKGAGGMPTAGSVVADILRAARGDSCVPPVTGPLVELTDPGEVPARHYLRLMLPDKPGTLARVAGALGAQEVGIAAVEQPEKNIREGDTVPVRLLTHPVSTSQLDGALATLDEDLRRPAKPVRIRIEE